jgi:formate dehydrogenase
MASVFVRYSRDYAAIGDPARANGSACNGYPKSYAKDDLPKIDHYPGGQTLPMPKAIDITPGSLLGSVPASLACGNISSLRVTPSSSRPTRTGRFHLRTGVDRCGRVDLAAVLAGLSDGRTHHQGQKLNLALTAGIGSDHVDLQAAIDRGVTVAEVTYFNSISVAEHVVMIILGLVRNYIPCPYRILHPRCHEE